MEEVLRKDQNLWVDLSEKENIKNQIIVDLIDFEKQELERI